MPPQDPLRKGHAAASDDAAVHGQPPAQAVMDGRGKERKRRKHEDAAAGAGVATTAAQLSEINVAADGGGDTGGARRHQHRRPRAPASEGAESSSGKPGHGATIVIGGRPRHQAAAASGSCATGGGSFYYVGAHAAPASSSSPRLLREPHDASPSPRQHDTAKPPAAGARGPRALLSIRDWIGDLEGMVFVFSPKSKKQEGLCLVLRLNAADEIAGVQEAVLPEDADGGLGAAATPAEGATARRRLRRLVQSGPEQRQLLLQARESSR